MRQAIEQLMRAAERARHTRQAIDYDADPAAWARADQAVMEATGRLAREAQEAVRREGLNRDLSRALAGTGFGVSRIAFDALDTRLLVELEGGPTNAAQQRKAVHTDTAAGIRTLTDEFFSQTGIELAFPYQRLTGE
jgi:hypothetical protein